jgi:predicted DNA-binding protein with PD1-like motif/glutaredoxin
MTFQALRTVALQLEPGSDVRLSLEQLGREQGANGFVLSVVGNLSQAAFQCPGQPQPTLLSGVLEIITLQGTVGPQGVHLHLSLSDSHCQVWGGHLEPGALVHSVCELLVGFLEPAAVEPGGAGQAAAAPGPGASRSAARRAGAMAARAGATARAMAARSAAHGGSAADQKPRVEVGVLAGCPWSARALRLLRTLGIPYALVEPRPGASVPQITIDGVAIGGYDALVDLHGKGDLQGLRQL